VIGQTVCPGYFTATVKARGKAEWALDLIWMFWRRDSSLAAAKISIPDLPAHI